MTEMENITEDKPICIIEVNENLRRVKLGMELTRPLKQLNSNCEFRKKYEEWCNIQQGLEPDVDIKKIELKAKMREYYRTHPEYRAKIREYLRLKRQKIKKIENYRGVFKRSNFIMELRELKQKIAGEK